MKLFIILSTIAMLASLISYVIDSQDTTVSYMNQQPYIVQISPSDFE